jgi:hypothetical protein
MREVKTQPRFKCDFCRHTSTEKSMRLHEKRCYRNPNRFCDFCDNKGVLVDYIDEGLVQETPCPFCEKLKKGVSNDK